MKKAILFSVGTAVVITGGAGAYTLSHRAPETRAYFSDVVRVGDIEQAVTASGELQPLEVIDVGVEASGQVTALTVGVGDRVAKGQVLGQIDPILMENAVRSAQNQLNRARNGQRNRETALTFARRNLDRQQTLRDQGFGTAVAYEAALTQVQNAELALVQTTTEIRQAELELEARRSDLNLTTIRAPIAGIVSQILAPEGAMVSTRRGAPIVMRIAKLDTMTVRAPVSEADVVKVKQGQKVYFTTLAEPDRRYTATLRAVEVAPANGELEPSETATTRGAVYYNALFDVPNEHGELLPAMTAEVRIVMGEAEQVPLMPAVSLGPRDANGRYAVQVVEADGDLVQKSVSIGLTDGVAAEVKAGLDVGDRVVTGQAVGIMEG